MKLLEKQMAPSKAKPKGKNILDRHGSRGTGSI